MIWLRSLFAPELAEEIALGGVARRTPLRAGWLLPLLLWAVAEVCCSGQGTRPKVRVVSAVAYDSTGNLYLADAASNQVFEATVGGSLLVFAGTGVQGSSGDGGPAVAAELNVPQGIAVAPDGTVYVADTGNERVRAIDGQGQIRTVAGTGSAGFSGDGGVATAAALRHPTALAVDATGAVLVCDTGNGRVRRLSQGVLGTIAGNGLEGFSGDGGPATAASLGRPQGVAADAAGNLFIADTRNNRVRRVSPAGLITTFAGTGQPGFEGDGGPATSGKLSGPRGLALGAAGELLIADAGNQRVRSVTTAGVLSTVIGTGTEGGSQDGVAALGAAMRAPRAVALSSLGMPVVADSLNGAVRVMAGAPGLFLPAALAPEREPTQVGLSSAAPVTYGQELVGATVSGAVGIPQGQVAFSEAGASLAAVPLAGGTSPMAFLNLASGAHNVTLLYGGDGLNPAAASNVTVGVMPAPVTALMNPVTVPYGTAMPAFSGTLLGVLPADAAEVTPVLVDSSGAGQLAVGTYPAVFTLTGAKAANYTLTGTAATGTVSVVRAASVTGVTAPVQAFAGMPVPLRVTVSAAAKGQPTGTVQFLDGGALVATAAVQNGSASVVYPGAQAGTRQLAAVFSGDSNFLPSSSPVTTLSVLAVPDFSLGLSGEGTASVAAGTTAKFSFSVAAAPGPFTGAVSLSVSALPPGATVSFSPPQVVPGTGNAVVTMAVQTVASSGTASAAGGRGTAPQVLFASLLGVMCLFSPRRKRLLGRLSLVCLMCGLSGCGARTVGQAGNGLLAKTYALTITGTATNLAGAVVSHSLPVALTVQQ